jgi:PAS domain S-box-containing protein
MKILLIESEDGADVEVPPDLREALERLPQVAVTELNLDGQRLQDQAFLLASAQRLVNMGVWLMDLRTNRLYWSDETCALFGIAPHEFHQSFEQFQGFILPEDIARFRQQHTVAHDSEVGMLAAEYRIRRPNGEIRWMRELGQVEFDEAGEAIRRLGVIIDISEQRQAEERLRHSESLLRMASRAGRMGAWAVDLPDLQVTWSDEVARIHEVSDGYMPVVSEGINFYAPEYRERISEVFTACVERGTPYDEELQIITAKGRRVWVRSIGQAVRNQAGEIVRVQGAFQDISDRKEAERSLVRSQERFRQLADAMPIIVWTAGPDGTVDFSNQAFSNYTGIPQNAPPATRWQSTLHPDDLERCLALWQESVKMGKHFLIEYRIRRGIDSSYRWFTVQATPVRDEEGAIIKWYGSAANIHDIKQLETESRELAQRLNNTLESITDAVFTLDHEWRFTFVNSEAERLLQRSREEMLGNNVWELFPEAVGTTFYKVYHQTMREGRTLQAEDYYPPLQTWFNVRAYPSVDGLTVYFQDVTEQRKARQSLIISEERFKNVARATNDTIWDWDLTTNEVWWNEGMQTLFGYPPEALEPDSSSWTNRIHPKDRAWVVADIDRAIAGQDTSWEAEYRFVCQDGSIAYVLDRAFIIRNADGDAVRVVGGMTDLTQRKRNEERLREQATLLDRASDAILVRDLNHEIVYWNQGATHIFGWTAQEALGKSAVTLLCDEPHQFHAATRQLLKDGEWSGLLTQRHKDGRPVQIEARWSLVRDDAGRPRSVLAINTDVTERRQMEVRFLRAQRMESIGILAGGIAHDLNNVLSPIILSIPLLKRTAQTERDRARLEMLEESAKRGAEMVRQVLTFARGAEGTRTQVKIDHIARDVMRLMQDTLGKDIRIRLDVTEEPYPVQADPTQIHQVLVNLCVNARDAMPQGGQLSIEIGNLAVDEQYAGLDPAAEPGHYVRLTVADTGVGIPADVLPRIFDPFYTTKDVGKGTGLGLSTVQGIVKGHGGFINVYSEEDKGTIFRLYFPAQMDEANGNADTHNALLPQGNGELILVVDDEHAVRVITQQTLEAYGYQTLLAEDGAEAISIYAKRGEEIAVVLTDMMMPIMNGFATIQALKKLNPDVKIIAASGLAADGMVAKAMSAGVYHFLAKPYTAESILKTLAEILKEDEP